MRRREKQNPTENHAQRPKNMVVWEQEGRLGEPRVSQEHIHPSNPFTQPASQPSPQAQSHKQFDARYLKDGRFWTRTASQRARQPSSPARSCPAQPATHLDANRVKSKDSRKPSPEAALHPNPMESVSVVPFFKF